MAARSGSEFCGVVTGLDAKLLNVFQTRLQTKRRSNLSIQIAGTRIDGGGAFDAVVTDDVLLGGSPGEVDVAEGTRTAVDRSWRLQIELRNLSAV